MKTFHEWVEANHAKLGDVSDHPLFNKVTPPPVPPKKLVTPPPVPPQKKLDNDAGVNGIVDQYLSAFSQKLDSNISDEEAHKIIDVNAKKLGFRFGKTAEDFFRRKALFKLTNMRSYQSAISK